MAESARYSVIRFYERAGIRRRVIARNLTLEQAQEHCTDPEASSETAAGPAARARTRRLGRWFDGYERQ